MHTHRIIIVRNHAQLGTVDASFNTTADAVRIHCAALRKQMRGGSVVSFRVVTL